MVPEFVYLAYLIFLHKISRLINPYIIPEQGGYDAAQKVDVRELFSALRNYQN